MQLKNLKDQKSEETKSRLLEATQSILEEYGVQYCTVRNICEESGVSSGSFYHHFGSKENVINACIEELYKKSVEINIPPVKLLKEGFAVDIMWPFLVYAKFCESIGKEVVQLLAFDKEQDIFFKNTFSTDAIRKPVADFLTNPHSRYDNPEIIEDIFWDMQMIYRGALVNWIYSGENTGRSLSENMEHLLFRFLVSFVNDEGIKEIEGFRILICERDDFDSLFDMSFIKIAK